MRTHLGHARVRLGERRDDDQLGLAGEDVVERRDDLDAEVAKLVAGDGRLGRGLAFEDRVQLEELGEGDDEGDVEHPERAGKREVGISPGFWGSSGRRREWTDWADIPVPMTATLMGEGMLKRE